MYGGKEMNDLLFFDATLRDGSHAIKHQFNTEQIISYCENVDDVGMSAVIVGHGNGLGASSLQVGLSKISDHEMLQVAKKHLRKTKLGAYLIPGFGTIKEDIDPAISDGVDLFKIGCQCTEADITRQHIEYVKSKGKDAFGVLMMYHMTTTDRLLEEAQKMQSYGADGVIIMDSAGASTPELVKKTISTLCNGLRIPVGIHTHNNMGLAVSNTYIAIQEGATIIDGTIRGFGAGAGNCPLEVISALLKKEGYSLRGVDWYKMLDLSEKIVSKFQVKDKGIDDISIVSGVAGVFSAFKQHVINAAAIFDVDPRDIFMELGERKVMAGQEDIIVDVAEELKNRKILNNNFSF